MNQSSTQNSGKDCFVSDTGSSEHSLLPIYKVNQNQLKIRLERSSTLSKKGWRSRIVIKISIIFYRKIERVMRA